MSLTTLLSCAILLGACASQAEPAPPVDAPSSGKVRAPVELTLRWAAPTVSLTVRATAPIPRAVARIILPPGATTGAPTEHELGAMAEGETRVVAIPLALSGAAVTIAAGVDCHLASGVKLYAVTTLDLAPDRPELVPDGRGLTPGTAPRPERDLTRHGLRAEPARRRTDH